MSGGTVGEVQGCSQLINSASPGPAVRSEVLQSTHEAADDYCPGGVHKVRHAIFGQYWPPPPVTLCHTSRDPPRKYVTHLGSWHRRHRQPPRAPKKKTKKLTSLFIKHLETMQYHSIDDRAGPAPGIGDIGSRLGRQILGGANFMERRLFSDNNTLYNN